MKKLFLITLLSFSLINIHAQTNNNNPLEGLTEVSLGDFGTEKLSTLDFSKTPIYNSEGEKIDIAAFQKLLSAGGFLPFLYLNKKDKVKAILVRKATPDELAAFAANSKKAADAENNKYVGKQAIPFSATDIAGNSFDLEALKGKVVVLNFWFIACKPCIQEMPELNEIVKEYEKEDVVFLALSFDGKSAVEGFLEKNDFDYNIISDARKTIKEYGVNAFPTHIIIGKDGKVEFFTQGLSNVTIENIQSKIKALVNS